MPRLRRIAALVLLLAFASGASGCTIVKPITGAVTGPIYGLAALAQDGNFCGCDDGRALGVFIIGAAGVGAVAGLVTGIISDVQALRGRADDPMRNWWQPFATNTSGGDW